jgi:hypothetical protein
MRHTIFYEHANSQPEPISSLPNHWIERALSWFTATVRSALDGSMPTQSICNTGGISLSPAFVVMFVMRRCQLSWEDALHLVQNRRYCISPNGGFLTQIKVSFVSASLVSFAFLCLELLSCTATKHAVRELYVLMLCPRNTSRYTRHPLLLPGFRKGRCKELSPGGREMMMTMRRKSGASISGNYPLFFVSLKLTIHQGGRP